MVFEFSALNAKHRRLLLDRVEDAVEAERHSRLTCSLMRGSVLSFAS